MGPNTDRRRLEIAWPSAHLRAGHRVQGHHALISHWLQGGKAEQQPDRDPADAGERKRPDRLLRRPGPRPGSYTQTRTRPGGGPTAGAFGSGPLALKGSNRSCRGFIDLGYGVGERVIDGSFLIQEVVPVGLTEAVAQARNLAAY